MPVPFASTKEGLRIHYRDLGEPGRPPVVLIMGIGVSGAFWGPVPQWLSEHSTEPLRVLVVDNRGTGDSELRRRPFRVRDMADDVAAVLDHARLDRAAVVGISLGGMIAQHVAIRHPERVAALGLFCTTPGLPLGIPPHPLALKSLVKGFVKGMRDKEFLELMYPRSQLPLAVERLRTPEFGAHFKQEQFNRHTFFLHLWAASLHTTRRRELASIRCPTIVMTGEQDVLIPPSNSRRLVRYIPGARLRTLPDVGHDMMTLAPDAICDAVRELATAEPANADRRNRVAKISDTP